VDQDLLCGFRLGIPAGSFDEFSVDEGRSGADHGTGKLVLCVTPASAKKGDMLTRGAAGKHHRGLNSLDRRRRDTALTG
jgi:hypothetical protein